MTLTNDDVMKLVNAGYSKPEIDEMFSTNEPAVEPENNPVPENTEPESEPEPTPEDVETAGILKEYMSQVNALFEDMTQTLKSIQSANVKNTNFPEGPTTSPPEDIIGKVIAPQNYRKEE